MAIRALSLVAVLAVSTAGCIAGEPVPALGDREAELGDLGRHLFDRETFAGNGRTCRTCHSSRTGTISPEQARRLYGRSPGAPLFRAIDSDDGAGDSYERLLTHATFRVPIDLPDNVHIEGDPGRRQVILHRGVPTTMNTPALDGVLMADGRAPSLEAQAADAIAGHAEAGRAATEEELAVIADFERSDPRFFSSAELRRYAYGGDDPELPRGNTPSERRGRAFFVEGGRCAGCHGGPMLNETGSGRRFLSASVSERNLLGNPVYRFVFTADDGTETVIESPDPGRALITGDARDANRFKIPTLWGVARTAPYFHDNSAQTLAEVVEQYSWHFERRGDAPLTAREQRDIVAYMRLLR